MDILRRWQRVSSAVALVAFLAVVGAAEPASAQGELPVASDPAGSNIQIVQTPAPGPAPGFCLPQFLAMRYTTSSDATTFRLRVTVIAPLCAPITAVAAIYAMPGSGVSWPQTLLETKPAELSGPGVTEIVFTRGCRPVQFDVVTGATPQEIAPWGAHHGPLLFPFDTDTTRQYAECGPAPVVPEAPVALLLPLSAVALAGGVVGLMVIRRRRPSSV